MTAYKRAPTPTDAWAAAIDQVVRLRLGALAPSLRVQGNAIVEWFRGKLVPSSDHCNPDQIGVSLFGLFPVFDDKDFDFVAKWKHRSVGYRMMPATPTDETAARISHMRATTASREQPFTAVFLTLNGDRLSEKEWRRPTENVVPPVVVNETVPLIPAGRTNVPAQEAPAARVTRGRSEPHRPQDEPIEEREIIGSVSPGEVGMGRTGTLYKVAGILFHSEIENTAILRGASVILEGRRDNVPTAPYVRVFARIVDATVRQTSTIAKTPTTTAHLEAEFELIREAYPNPDGTVQIRTWTPKPMAGYQVRWPRRADLDVLGYPEKGIPMGEFEAGASRLPFLLPVDALYRSVFAVGGMGGGKTNFLSCIARAISNSDPRLFDGNLRPAVVILDAEGRREYADLGEAVATDLRAKVEEAGIGPHAVRDFQYLELGAGKRTFVLDDITFSDTSVFPATLPAKSERSWTQAAETVWRFHKNNRAPVRREDFTAQMADAARRYALNASMRNAMLRAAMDRCWDVFDIPEATPIRSGDLLVPGRVSIVDVSGLDGADRQRAGGLALLTILDIAKRETPQNPCPILLIIDEATRLIPASQSGMSAREYSDKMGGWLSQVLHRGRRAKYGLLLATQYPTDVLPALRDQPQTKVAFALQAKFDTWMKKEFGAEVPARLRDAAQVGFAYVSRVARVDGDRLGVPHPATAVQFPQVR